MGIRKKIAAIALLGLPITTFAFQTTEDILWPEEGSFPAYPKEPDERRVEFSLSGGLHHDSNLFRLSDSANARTAIGRSDKSANVARVGIGLKANLPVSQQRLLIDASIDDYKYEHFGLLNHVAYRAGAAWKWQLERQWSGEVGYQRQHYLSSLAEIQAKDMISVDHAFANAGYLLTPRWRIRGGFDWFKYNHGDVTRTTLDNRTTSATAGLDYLTLAGNSIGGQFKYTTGEFPKREFVAASFVDNEFNETETSMVAHWMPTGKSTLDGRLGYTRRTHSQLSQRDFSGVTGRLSYDWTPGAKTLLNFALWREIRSIEDTSASFILSRGASFGPGWAPTSKLVLQAKLIYEKRNFEGDPGFVLLAGPQREDIFRGLRLAAGYAPRRNIELAVAAERGERGSNVFGRDYNYNAFSANAKLRF